jgi:polysaccharide deacetylase family protein (PEP-CTERM system associated)
MRARQAPPRSPSRPRGILSVDVEDYFQVEAFAGLVNRAGWDQYPSRVADNTRQLLDLLEERGVKATFFVLGWVAEKFPSLVGEIALRGHEPACHSHWHRLVYQLSPEEFRQDAVRAKQAIEQAAGAPVTGYRAPSYSITRKALWALEILVECGFRYDSSIFPIRHDVYGIPDAPRRPFRVQTPAGPLVEYPLTTFRLPVGPNLPVGGGGYLRIFPYWLTAYGLQRALRQGVTVVTYLHPWEIDPRQPRLAGRLLSRWRHYTRLDRMADRLHRLCGLIDYVPFRDFDAASVREEWRLS